MRKLRLFPLVLMILLCLAPSTSAHKGKTDENGGHRDGATGEYHYHHGYPAHSHYDMDGDGDIDCPYDFDDQTNHSSSNSTGSDSTRTQGLTFTDGYESGYDMGYQHGVMDAEESAEEQKQAAYEKGYKDGEAAAMESMSETIQEKASQATKDAILGTLGVLIALGGPILILGESLLNTLESWFRRPKQAKKPKPNTAPPDPTPTRQPPKEPPQHEPFVYELNPEPPKPPRLGPADEAFTLIKRSSFIAAVCYKNGHLYVRTTQGDYLMYYNVPRPVYLDFMNAPSMGRFFNQRIKDNYPFGHL